MKRCVVVLARFPFTDLKASKRRPAVVVSQEGGVRDDVIVAFITSVIPDELSDTDFMMHSGLDDFKDSGLTRPSVIKADKIATLNSSVLSGELGHLSKGAMKEIDRCLKKALGLT